MHLPKNIRHLASVKGISNSSLAKELNVSPSQIGYYMSGKSNPKMEALIILGKLFNVNVHDLILLDLTKETGREFGSKADNGSDSVEDQTKELNKLLRLRVAELEREIKERDPGLAGELGIE